MARRFSSLAKNMDNIGLGLKKGKSIVGGRGTDAIREGLRQKGRDVELLATNFQQEKLVGNSHQLSEQLKQAGRQLQRLAQNAKENDLNLDKLIKGIDKSSKQLSQLSKQNKKLQQKYASKIADVSGKLDMIRKELKGMGSIDPQKESNTQKIKEYIKKQKAQLESITKNIKKDPTSLSRAAKELRKLSNEMEWTAAQEKRSLDKNAVNSLDKTISQAKKLAADIKREAESQKPKVSDVIKAIEETMRNTKKKMEEIKKADSPNPAKTVKKEKKIAALSKEMEKLNRLKSRLGADRMTDSSQSDRLQNQSGLKLKKMAEQLNKNNNLDTARKLSGDLEKMIQQLKNRQNNRDRFQKLSQLKDKLNDRIEKIERERKNTKLSREIQKLAREIQQQKSSDKIDRLSSQLSRLAEQLGDQLQDNTDKSTGSLSKDLRRELDKTKKDIKQLSDKIKKRESFREIKKKAKELEKQAEKTAALMDQEKKSGSLSPEQAKKIEKTIEKARKLSRKIQNGKDAQDIKKFTVELDEISNKMADMSMGMRDGSRKRSLQDDSVREIIRDVGDSLKEITQRLDENIDRDKISSDLTDLSEELSNLDLGGKKKIDSDENITESDKKIINETGSKLKELAGKAITQKNPKDIRQMATDLINLAGNLSNLDLGKSEQQGKKSTSNVTGKNREFRSNKLKQLAKELKGSNKMTRKRKIASQISKFVSSAGPQDAQRTHKAAGKNKNDKQGNSASFFKKILNLPQFFRKDKKIKEQKNKSTKERDKNDLTRTAAVNKIDKLIKNLKRKKKKLPGIYNSKRVLKKAGVSSKGAGSIQKGIVGKMTQSNYSKAKFTDSNVSKDINILPNSDIVNNTYIMEQNLTDREVFERIIERLEKNREYILAEGGDPHKVMSAERLPLSHDYQPRPAKPSKQPIEGDDARMMAGLGAPDKVEIPGNPPLEKKSNMISNQSFMDRKNNSEFLKMPIKLDKKDTASLPSERLQKLRGRKPYRLNASQAQDDSMADQTVPEEYMDIIRQLYLHLEESSPPGPAPVGQK
jgi:ABC-type transporter Mla subunit MlaD